MVLWAVELIENNKQTTIPQKMASPPPRKFGFPLSLGEGVKKSFPLWGKDIGWGPFILTLIIFFNPVCQLWVKQKVLLRVVISFKKNQIILICSYSTSFYKGAVMLLQSFNLYAFNFIFASKL